jgi:hypothetical protein
MGDHPAAEIIGYFAIEQGVCENVVAGTTDDTYDHNWKEVAFGVTFPEAPFTFVQM